MKLDTLQNKITRTKLKIEKKILAIAKKEKSILTKEPNDWMITSLKYDIRRLNYEINATKSTLLKYEKQLAGELSKNENYNNVPECLKELEVKLIKEWNVTETKNRDYLSSKYKELGYEMFFKFYTQSDYSKKDYSDEMIVKLNINDAKNFVIDLYNRIITYTGEVVGWNEFNLSKFTLSGFISGKEGRIKIETIVAGGYNIQKLHLRVLIHEIN